MIQAEIILLTSASNGDDDGSDGGDDGDDDVILAITITVATFTLEFHHGPCLQCQRCGR